MLLLKGYLEREKINFHEKNFKYRKIILSINFIFAPTFFLISPYQILKNYAILINYKSLVQGKDSLQLNHFQLSKIIIKFSNLFIKISFWGMFLQWFQPLKNLFLKIRNCEVVGNLFCEKMIHDLLKSHNFLKFSKK